MSESTEVASFESLIAKLKESQKFLNDKADETKIQRHLFRRIPLYSGVGFIFFILCLILSTFDDIGLTKVHSWLELLKPSLMPSNLGWVFLCLTILNLIVFFWRSANKCGIKSRDSFSKGMISLCLLSGNIWLLFVVLYTEFAVPAGLALFGTITLSAMLIERVLGYTRSNERNLYFCRKAENLATLYTSMKKMNGTFSEEHLREYSQFVDEVQLAKYQDTVGDTHYLLRLVEQKINGTV